MADKGSSLAAAFGCLWTLAVVTLAGFTLYRGWPWSWWWIGIILAAFGWLGVYSRINETGESAARMGALFAYLAIAIGCAIGCILTSYLR